VHGRLGVLGGHVEPESREKGHGAITFQLGGVSEQDHLVILLLGESNVGELTIVVVPGELEGTSAVVLNTGLRRPRGGGPVGALVVAVGGASGPVRSSAVDFGNPVKSTAPVSSARLSREVSEECAQLSLARVVQGVATAG